MSSRNIDLPVGVWTVITTGETSGSIRHRSGGSVVYTEQAEVPESFGVETPTLETSNPNSNFPYWGIASGEFLYALALNESSKITVTPAAEA